MITHLNDPRILKILTPPRVDSHGWKAALERFDSGDVSLTRHSAGEAAIKAIQRMLIFLGYSTSAVGAFSIDGDFGRGTNRGVAQFQFDRSLTRKIDRKTLCYPCTWNTASARITQIPEVRLTRGTMQAMVDDALVAIETNNVMCGSFETAVTFLNAVHSKTFLNCQQIRDRYLRLVSKAIARVKDERGIIIRPEWILAIIRQETAGIVRPRFEQHLLSRMNKSNARKDIVELRFRAMSQGLGQVLGDNYKRVGAESAVAMYTSPLDEQVLFVARFLSHRPAPIKKKRPGEADFRTIARYYNGPGYAKHHYHERIQRWFREFQLLLA